MVFFYPDSMLGVKGAFSDGSSLGLGTKESAAMAVLRDAWQNGHQCVELRRDGRRVIFLCTLCSTFCYNDKVLSDHLRGNQHSRCAASAFSSSGGDEGCPSDQRSDNLRDPEQSMYGKAKHDSKASLKSSLESESLLELPASSLELIGSAQFFLKESHSHPSRQVKAVWCQWLGSSCASDTNSVKAAEKCAYAVVIFPYSDAIGRKGDWKPALVVKNGGTESRDKLPTELSRKGLKTAFQNDLLPVDPLVKDGVFAHLSSDTTKKHGERGSLLLSKEFSQRSLRMTLKKRRLNLTERFCFICHQQMLPGKDMAGLLNVETGKMMCDTRNARGAFHVFHTSCLIDWILMCEAKFWSAPAAVKGDDHRMRGQMSSKPQRGRRKSTPGSNGTIFCPECQGTGVQILGHQLEKPRYRLAQVFDWILELVQARRLWMEHSEQRMNTRGLLLGSDLSGGGKAIPLGLVQLYAAGNLEFLVGTTFARSRLSSKVNA